MMNNINSFVQNFIFKNYSSGSNVNNNNSCNNSDDSNNTDNNNSNDNDNKYDSISIFTLCTKNDF